MIKRGINTSEFWFLVPVSAYLLSMYTVTKFTPSETTSWERVSLIFGGVALLSVYAIARAIVKGLGR